MKWKEQSYIILNDTSGISNHLLVVSELLVASSSVIIASTQNIVHLSLGASGIDSLGVLQINDRSHIMRIRSQ